MDCSTPGFPVHHQLLKLAETHVHRVDDAIQPSHPLSSPSPALNLSQHQGLFQLVSSLPSGGQSIGVSASASVLPVNIQDSFPLGLTGLISLQSKGLSRVFYNTRVQKYLWHSPLFIVQLSHPYVTTEKTIALTRQTFVGKVMSLLLNMLSRLVMAFVPRSKCLLISWLRSPSAVILVHGVIKARILKRFAIPFSNGPHFVKTLHHDPSVLDGLHSMAHSFFELDKAVVHVISLVSFV